jgi:tRNA G18 (ribose-2'-O)-methylase SpoU
MRKTRRDRYNEKIANGEVKYYPFSLCAVNFQCDENLAYLVRTAACFGLRDVHVIGSIPNYEDMRRKSGTLHDYVNIHQYSTPSQFMEYARRTKMCVISVELTDGAINLHDLDIPSIVKENNNICFVVGNETTGVPAEILHTTNSVFIPMPGAGFCLNTSQAANIVIYEAVKQMEEQI